MVAWSDRPARWLGVLGLGVLAGLAACGDGNAGPTPGASSVAAAPAGAGRATAAAPAATETDPSTSDPDDVAIWVHPEDPAASRLIVTEKDAGLAVYDLEGQLVQVLGAGSPNNVDLRYAFPWPDGSGAIVTAGYRSSDSLAVLTVDERTGEIEEIEAGGIPLGYEPYGSCMYRSPRDGSFYVFVNTVDGDYRQYRISPGTDAPVAIELVRSFALGSHREGCVADDDRQVLYVGEEEVGIWRVGAEPDAGADLVAVDSVDAGRLTPDIEGLTLYATSDGGGYLIAASQGSSEFVVYDRVTLDHVLTFAVGDGPVDDVDRPDGIAAVGALGSRFPSGLFVAHDSEDQTGAANFKLVPWERIAGLAVPPLVAEPADSPGS